MDVSVVVATRDRARRLSRLLEALRAQTLPSDRCEVIVVDDGSTDATPAVLAGAAGVRVIRLDSSRGPAAARNAGWRAGTGRLVAFTDDDCRPAPSWLAELLAAGEANPGAVLQGRVEIDPEEMDAFDPFAHTLWVHDAGQGFPTANIAYPRELLERLGGFDESFARAAGEDTDLGWRALEAGAEAVFADRALVHHGVVRVGAVAKLRSASRWTDAIANYPRHPGMRATLVKRVFWRHNHWLLFRFLVGVLLPHRLGPLRLLLAAPYVVHLTDRRTGPLLAPYLLALDLAEVIAVVRGAIRHRVLVL